MKDYTQKDVFTQAELCSCFMDLKCTENGNICEFLDELHVKREKLATDGVTIKDKDYHLTIITSLPHHLSNFASSLFANTRLHATFDPDELIALILEEYDHGVSQHAWHSATKLSNVDDKDEALYVSSGGKANHNEHKPHGVC